MINAQKLADFRASRTPISGFWNVNGAESHGSVIWQEENAVLVLTLELKGQDHADLDDIDHPLFNASKPPLQPTITSKDPIYKLITLKNCFRTHIRGSTNTSTGQTAYELEFHVSQIWLGDALSEVDGNVKYITISDERIAGIFGNPGLTTIDSYQGEYKEVFSTLGNPRTIWTVHGPTANNIKLGSTGLSLSITTGAMTGFSARTGRSINTTVEINLYSEEGRSIKSAIEQIFSLEQLISTFSLEAFSFKYVVFGTGERAEAGLAWQIDDRDVFQPLMRHQVLVDLSSPEVLSAICNQWFNASATVQLSRWLFSRALAETKSGLSRFVTVSQAFEVIGREYGPNAKMARSRIKEASDLIREVLSGKFEEKHIDRWVGLILSSNKSSYKDTLQHMIEEASSRHLPKAAPKVAAFCKDASDTRNAVVHMTDDDKGKLTLAFSKINKMSLMLCFWYAVVQAHKLEIEIPNIGTFLYNNRNARHGLPNEILERAGRSSRASA